MIWVYNGKQLLRIRPHAREAEAGRNGKAGEPLLRVFVSMSFSPNLYFWDITVKIYRCF